LLVLALEAQRLTERLAVVEEEFSLLLANLFLLELMLLLLGPGLPALVVTLHLILSQQTVEQLAVVMLELVVHLGRPNQILVGLVMLQPTQRQEVGVAVLVQLVAILVRVHQVALVALELIMIFTLDRI
jgi:hypothetical protein